VQTVKLTGKTRTKIADQLRVLPTRRGHRWSLFSSTLPSWLYT